MVIKSLRELENVYQRVDTMDLFVNRQATENYSIGELVLANREMNFPGVYSEVSSSSSELNIQQQTIPNTKTNFIQSIFLCRFI